MIQYEDGREAQVGDAGMFTYASDGQGYLYDGTVAAISETGRLEIRGYDGSPVTLIMADQVIFEPAKPQDVGPQYWPPRS
jgi:hypothetical protein